MTEISRRKFLAQCGAAVIASGLSMTEGVAQTKGTGRKIRLLWTNDMHSYLRPFFHRDYYDTDSDNEFVSKAAREGRLGGMAHLAALVKRLRGEMPESSLLLDSGDTWHGTGIALFRGGSAMVAIMNKMGYDAMTPGNVDFLFRKADFLKNVEACNFPVIAVNMSDMDSDDLILKPYVIKEASGVKVGIIGLTYQWTAKTGDRSLTEGWSFGIREKETESFAIELRKDHGCDIVIAISHMGKGADMKFASRVRGIDAILGGHTHDLIERPVEITSPDKRKTLVCQAGSHGKNLGCLDLRVRDKSIAGYECRVYRIRAGEIKPDPDVLKLVDEEYARFEWIGKVLGRTDTILYRRATWQNPMDNFITDAYRKLMKTDIAFGPAWRFGATILPGSITYDDLYCMVPANDHIWVVSLKGSTLIDIIEGALDNVVNDDPYLNVGGDMIRFSGMEISLDLSKPFGQRVLKLSVNRRPVDADKVYTAATASSQIHKHPDAINVKDTGKVAAVALADFIEANSPVSSYVDKRLRDKNGNILRGQRESLFMGTPLY